jgi:hypothetical protein
VRAIIQPFGLKLAGSELWFLSNPSQAYVHLRMEELDRTFVAKGLFLQLNRKNRKRIFCVLRFGDLNYRIDLPREEATALIAECQAGAKPWSELLRMDQLTRQRVWHTVQPLTLSSGILGLWRVSPPMNHL